APAGHRAGPGALAGGGRRRRPAPARRALPVARADGRRAAARRRRLRGLLRADHSGARTPVLCGVLKLSRPFFPSPWRLPMSRAPLWRALAAFTVIASSLLLALTMTPRLGLDLRGGSQLVFETRDAPNVKADAESTDRALYVLRRRADALGAVDPSPVLSSERRSILELTRELDPAQADLFHG